MAERITVFLLDDHEIVRRGLRDLLEAEDDIVVVGEASTEDGPSAASRPRSRRRCARRPPATRRRRVRRAGRFAPATLARRV